jgi:hypothetical protein
MAAKRLDTVVAAGKFGLGQGRVDFLVADVRAYQGKQSRAVFGFVLEKRVSNFSIHTTKAL